MSENQLIAPCGMNCGVCRAHLRKERKCPGCLEEDTNKSVSCIKCAIKNCEMLKISQSNFCFDCADYPCRRLKQMDKRYRTKYATSVIENLESIKKNGLNDFIENEEKRWHCAKCGGVICIHSGCCSNCGASKN
jgi:hypothetical protein